MSVDKHHIDCNMNTDNTTGDGFRNVSYVDRSSFYHEQLNVCSKNISLPLCLHNLFTRLKTVRYTNSRLVTGHGYVVNLRKYYLC